MSDKNNKHFEWRPLAFLCEKKKKKKNRKFGYFYWKDVLGSFLVRNEAFICHYRVQNGTWDHADTEDFAGVFLLFEFVRIWVSLLSSN
jgi:hypothetical protein